MKKLCKYIYHAIAIGLLSVAALAQGNPPLPLTATTLNFNLINPPVAPQQVTVRQVGTPGPSSQIYYYWVVSQSLIGNSTPAGPVPCYNGPSPFSSSSYCVINWQPAPNNTGGYDVLRNTTGIAPTGACTCSVAIGTSGTSYTDQLPTRNAYTVNTFNINAASFYLDNEAVAGNTNDLILRSAAGAFLLDLTKALGPVQPLVSDTVTSTVAQPSTTPVTLKTFTSGAGQWNTLGMRLHIRARGSSQTTTTQNVGVLVTIGGTVFQSAAIIQGSLTGGGGAAAWQFDMLCYVTTTGSSGVMTCPFTGQLNAASGLTQFIDNGGINPTVTVNLTGAVPIAIQAEDVTAGNASNSSSIYVWSIDQYQP